MATTTMGSPDRVNRDSTKILYWTIAALAVIALLIFLSMRTFNTTTLSTPATGTGGYTPPPPATDTDTGTSGAGGSPSGTDTNTNDGTGSDRR